MKNRSGSRLLRMTLLLTLTAVGLFAAGVRFHSEALAPQLERLHPRQYVRLHMVKGGNFTGELVRQEKNSVFVRIDKGIVSFESGEISQLDPLSPEQARDEMPAAQSLPSLVTWRMEDSAASKWKKLLDDNQGDWHEVMALMQKSSPQSMKALVKRQEETVSERLQEMEGR